MCCTAILHLVSVLRVIFCRGMTVKPHLAWPDISSSGLLKPSLCYYLHFDQIPWIQINSGGNAWTLHQAINRIFWKPNTSCFCPICLDTPLVPVLILSTLYWKIVNIHWMHIIRKLLFRWLILGKHTLLICSFCLLNFIDHEMIYRNCLY